VVVVDISMPHLDALELFKLLAAARYTGSLLIVSGQDEQVLQVTAHAATALGLATPMVHRKPIKLQALRESLLQVKPLNAA
jgi:YesN/AraC family two-component response regulator